jgi:phospholipid/cholesterol/gamma-HCH transport system substrate-binding protein
VKGTVVRLGIFVAVCLFFTMFLAFTIGNIDYRDPLDRNTYTVRATFDDVTGLISNDNVKIAGIIVGKVTDISLIEGRARVTMKIKNRYKVPSDTEASVRWRNLLGQRFVYLYPGTSPTVMKSGATIAKTRSVVDLGELFNRLGPIVRAIDPQQVNTFLDSFVAALDGNEGAVRSAVADLGKVAEAISQRDEAIGRILDNLSVLSDAIVNRDAQIRTTLENLVKLGATFGDNTKVLDAAITNLSSISSDLAAFLQANRTQVDSVIANLLVIVKAVESKLPDIGPTLAMLDDAALRLFTSSRYGEWLNQLIPCGRVIAQDVSCDAAKTVAGVPLQPNLDDVLGPVTGPLLAGILPRVPVASAAGAATSTAPGGQVRVGRSGAGGQATPGRITRGSEAIAQLLGVPLDHPTAGAGR